jgi:predicted AAA+ superfamily ATPase
MGGYAMIMRREYLDRLIAFQDNKLIKVITGIRRCGKSTLLQLFKEHLLSGGVSEKNIIEMNFELMEFDDIRDYKELYQRIKRLMPAEGRSYLLLDEIQQVAGWEKSINSLNNEADTDIYLTGSNAYLLSSEISTLLSGRTVEIRMLPLSFKEFTRAGHLPSSMSVEDQFNQYLKFGSFPAVTTLPQSNPIINEFLLGIYNTVIIKDVMFRNALKDTHLLDRIVRFVISNTGDYISANRISGFLNDETRDAKIKNHTVSNYLGMLERAYIVYQVPRYDIRGKEILKTLSKYYVVDTGMRNMLFGYTDHDLGHVLETVVYFELLRRGYQVFVGKWYDKEVDFLAVTQDEKKYFQVTLSLLNEEVRARELAPLLAIQDNYEKIILSMDKSYITDHEGIRYMNIIDFLMGKA